MKKIIKVTSWIAGVVIALLILIVIGLMLFFPVEKAKNLVIEKASAQLGRKISIASADVSFWGGIGVKLGDVRISNPAHIPEGDLLKADNIDVKLAIFPLLSGNYSIDKLIINKPEIMMVKNADGTNNYTFENLEKKAPPEMVEKTPAEAKAAAVAITFDNLIINDGHLFYKDDSSHATYDLRGLKLSTSLQSPEKNYYKSSGEISIGALEIKNSIPLPLFSFKLDYNGEYDLNKKYIKVENTELGINNLIFNINGEVNDPFGDIKAVSNIKSKKISVEDLLSLLPQDMLAYVQDFTLKGDFALDVDLDYNKANPIPFKYFGTATITSLDLVYKKIPGDLKFKEALLDFENDNLRMNIKDGTFDGRPIKGHMVIENFANPMINGELAGSLNLAYLQPFLPEKQKHQLTGESEFEIKLSGQPKNIKQMSISGNLTVNNGTYNSDLLFEPVKSFNLDLYFDQHLTSIKKFTATTESGNLNFEGRINEVLPYVLSDSTDNIVPSPTIDGTLTGNLNLAILNKIMPPKGNPQLNGLLDLKLNLAGPVLDYMNIKPRGELNIKNASYSDSLLPEPIKSFNASFNIAPDTITVNSLNAKFVSSDASFSGKLIKPFPYLLPLKTLDRSKLDKPVFIFELTSHRFDSDKLFPEAVPGSGEGLGNVSVDSVSPVILPDIDGHGTIKIDTLIYSKVEFSSINGKVKIYDRKIECYDVTGKAYTGDVSGNTTIDLNDFENPVYKGEFKASQIEADDFISRFTKFGGFLFGKVDLQGDYNAIGWEPESFLNSLTMKSNSDMQKGKVVTSGVVYSALSGLAGKIDQKFEKEQSLKELKTNVTVKDGKVHLDNLKTRLGEFGDIELSGYYGFNGEMKYNGSIFLTQEMTQKLIAKKGIIGGLAGILGDNSVQRIKLPLLFGGTIDKPSFDIDYNSLTKNAEENVKDEAGNLIKDLFKKK